jgi:hypothetical protein
MSNLSAAVTALIHARHAVGMNRSDNQKLKQTVDSNDLTLPLDLRLAAVQAQLAHGQKSQDLLSLRGHKKNPQVAKHSRSNIVAYGKAAAKAGVGNCLEFSCCAAANLETQTPKPSWDLVVLGGGCDHIFVVIGGGAPDANGKYPTDMTTWPADAAVCDPWADLACKASEFPGFWRGRMENWGRIGIQLARVGPGGGFVDATDPYWFDAIANGDKNSFVST